MEKKVFTLNAPSHDCSVLKGKEVILDPSAAVKYYGFKNFITEYYPELCAEQKTILFPKGGWKDLKNTADEYPEQSRNVATATDKLTVLFQDRHLKCIGSESETSHETIIRHLVTNRGKKSFVVLTQKGRLASDILDIINSIRSVKGYMVEVYRINPDGSLGEFEFNNREKCPDHGQNAEKNEMERRRENDRFQEVFDQLRA